MATIKSEFTAVLSHVSESRSTTEGPSSIENSCLGLLETSSSESRSESTIYDRYSVFTSINNCCSESHKTFSNYTSSNWKSKNQDAFCWNYETLKTKQIVFSSINSQCNCNVFICVTAKRRNNASGLLFEGNVSFHRNTTILLGSLCTVLMNNFCDAYIFFT